MSEFPLAVGDTVYILGKYEVSEHAPLYIIKARISYIDHKCFIAYGLDEESTWRFLTKHYGKTVFKTEQEAVDELTRRAEKEKNRC